MHSLQSSCTIFLCSEFNDSAAFTPVFVLVLKDIDSHNITSLAHMVFDFPPRSIETQITEEETTALHRLLILSNFLFIIKPTIDYLSISVLGQVSIQIRLFCSFLLDIPWRLLLIFLATRGCPDFLVPLSTTAHNTIRIRLFSLIFSTTFHMYILCDSVICEQKVY